MLKRLSSMILTIVCLFLFLSMTVCSMTEIIENNFFQSGGWSGAGSVADGVLSITNSTSAAQGRINHFNNLDSATDWNNTTNSATIAAMEAHRHILKTQMTLSDIREAGIASQLNLVDTNMGYTASTYLVQLVSKENQRFDVYINDSPDGKTEPSRCVLEEVEENTFVAILIDLYKEENGWRVRYFVNGENVGSVLFTTGTPSAATGLRLRISSGTVAGTVAKFAEFTMTSHKTEESLPEFKVVSSHYTQGAVTLSFSSEISRAVAQEIKVNGEVWQDYEFTPDQKGVILGGLPEENITVSISGVYDIFGTQITPYSANFGETAPEDEYVAPVFYSWVPYENFSDWDHTYVNWSAGLQNTKPSSTMSGIMDEGGNKSIKILTAGVGSGMNRINKYAENEVLALLRSTDEDYTLLIKTRVCATAYGASSTSNEISFAQATSTKQRLFELTTTSLGVIEPKIHGRDVLPAVNLNQWIDVVITAKVTNGSAAFTYYVDGEIYSGDYTYPIAANGVDTISFAQRGFAEGQFDDIEVYLFTGDNPEFSYLELKDEDGNNFDALDPEKAVMLTFTSEISRELLVKEGRSSVFSLNGSNVSMERVKIGEDFKSVLISPPNREWSPHSRYVVDIDSQAFTDVFSTPFTQEQETIAFTTGGWKISASNGSFSSEVLSDGTLNVAFDISNVSDEAAKIKILIARCVGTREQYKIAALSESEYTIEHHCAEEGLIAKIEIEDAENSFVMAFVYNAENYRPVLKEPLVLE